MDDKCFLRSNKPRSPMSIPSILMVPESMFISLKERHNRVTTLQKKEPEERQQQTAFARSSRSDYSNRAASRYLKGDVSESWIESFSVRSRNVVVLNSPLHRPFARRMQQLRSVPGLYLQILILKTAAYFRSSDSSRVYSTFLSTETIEFSKAAQFADKYCISPASLGMMASARPAISGLV